MLVIPAIDLLDGKVVRLKKGSYEDVSIYNDDPLDEARKFAGAGFDRIHIVDLNGARDGSLVNLEQVKKIKKETELSIQNGGGIRSYDDAAGLIDTGIDQLVCSSMAVKNREDWMKLLLEYPERMILGMDLKDGKIAYGGWLETADATIESFLKPMIGAGLQYVLCTDIARDGMLEGVNIALYESLQEQYPELNFIASGGVASVEDFKQLKEAEVYGVVVGRAYYENEISLDEMKRSHSTKA